MTKNAVSRWIFEALASLRLAVVVMVTLGSTCLAATIYESRHGTPAVQRDVYRTWWFAAILVALAANIFCAMMKRYPWKSHHTGFVMAHIGILTLLAGSLLSLQMGLDGNMALFEGETTDRVALADKALQVRLPEGTTASVPVAFEKRPPAPGREQRFSIPGSATVLVAEDFQPHVKVAEEFVADPSGGAAVHVRLVNPFASQETWLSVSAGRDHVDLGPLSLGLHVAPGADAVSSVLHGTPGAPHISLVVTPEGKLFAGFFDKEGAAVAPASPLQVGAPLTTPWMGMTVAVDRLLPHARLEERVLPAPAPASEERRLPAVKVHLEGAAARSEPVWLAWSDAKTVALGGGPAMIAYRAPEVVVPFRVTLLDFNSDTYPGSNLAATYESRVRVDDPDRGVSEHHISMNHPLHYRGYIFFQASFVKGQPMMSILSVARSPGLPLVYLGVVLISGGVVWMFYVKPWLARRMAARAVAKRALERSHEGRPEAAVRVPAPPAEPASSGA